MTHLSPHEIRYDGKTKAGVGMIAFSGLCSIIATIYLLIKRPSARTFRGTHIFGYFFCLLASNVLQAVGFIVDSHWVARGGISQGTGCEIQGVLKQAGDIGAALWSLSIAIHVFTLVFLRRRSNKATYLAIVCGVWTFIVVWTIVACLGLQSSELGPYFGISREGCEISLGYFGEKIFFEYFLVMFSLVVSAILYLAVYLRIRSNKAGVDQTWRCRFTWRESTSDLPHVQGVPSSTMRIARLMLWFPVYYMAISLPVVLVQICKDHVSSVPFSIVTISSVLNGLMGAMNVLFFVHLLRRFPQTAILPLFSAVIPPIVIAYPTEAAGQGQGEKFGEGVYVSQSVCVDIPSEAEMGNVFVPPDSWKTSGGRGRRP